MRRSLGKWKTTQPGKSRLEEGSHFLTPVNEVQSLCELGDPGVKKK